MLPYPIDRRLRLCARVHSASFRRRVSSFVRGVLEPVALLLAAVLGERARCVRLAVRRACAWCCPVAAAYAAVRVRCDSRGAVCACGAQCERGGCERGVALLRERRACAPPVPVLEMPLMPR